MKYVDVDNDPTTINSSMAELRFPSEEKTWEKDENNKDVLVTRQLNPDCSEIIWAGLYWSGRAENDNTSVTKEVVIAEDKGTLTVNTDGTFTFVPAPGFSGTFKVPYVVTNNDGSSAVSFLSIELNNGLHGGAHKQMADGDRQIGKKGRRIPLELLANDYDSKGHDFELYGDLELKDGITTWNKKNKIIACDANKPQGYIWTIYKDVQDTNGTGKILVGKIQVGADGKGWFEPTNNFTADALKFRYYTRCKVDNSVYDWDDNRYG